MRRLNSSVRVQDAKLCYPEPKAVALRDEIRLMHTNKTEAELPCGARPAENLPTRTRLGGGYALASAFQMRELAEGSTSCMWSTTRRRVISLISTPSSHSACGLVIDRCQKPLWTLHLMYTCALGTTSSSREPTHRMTHHNVPTSLVSLGSNARYGPRSVSSGFRTSP